MKRDERSTAGPGERKTNDGLNKQMNEKKIVNEQDQEQISNDENNTKTQEEEPMDVEKHIEDLNVLDDITEDNQPEKAGLY